MPNFIYDGGSLYTNKVNLRPLPGGANVNNYLRDTDANALKNAHLDTRSAILAARWHGFADQGASDPGTPTAGLAIIGSKNGRLQYSENGAAFRTIPSPITINLADPPYNALSGNDIAAVLQAAVTAAAAYNGRIYIPGSVSPYKLLSKVIVPENITIFGDGPSSTVIQYAHGVRGALQLIGGSVTLDGFKLTTPQTGSPSNLSVGILLAALHTPITLVAGKIVRAGSTMTVTTPAPHGLVFNDKFQMTPGEPGFWAGVFKVATVIDPWNFTYTDSRPGSNGGNAGTLYLNKSSELGVTAGGYCLFNNLWLNGMSKTGFGIWSNSSLENTIQNCNIIDHHTGILLDDPDSIIPSNGWAVVSNRIRVNGYGIRTFSEVWVDDCTIEGNGIGIADEYNYGVGAGINTQYKVCNTHFENNANFTDPLTGKSLLATQIYNRIQNTTHLISNCSMGGGAQYSDIRAEAESSFGSGILGGGKMLVTGCGFSSGITNDQGQILVNGAHAGGVNGLTHQFKRGGSYGSTTIRNSWDWDGSSLEFKFFANAGNGYSGADPTWDLSVASGNDPNPNNNYRRLGFKFKGPMKFDDFAPTNVGNIQTHASLSIVGNPYAFTFGDRIGKPFNAMAGPLASYRLFTLAAVTAKMRIVGAVIHFIQGYTDPVFTGLTLSLGTTAGGTNIMAPTPANPGADVIVSADNVLAWVRTGYDVYLNINASGGAGVYSLGSGLIAVDILTNGLVAITA